MSGWRISLRETKSSRHLRFRILSLVGSLTLALLCCELRAQPAGPDSVLHLMAELLNKDQRVRDNAAARLAERNDRSVIPAFLEALRFIRPSQAWKDAMRTLTGESFGDDWSRWMEWYWNQNINPHPDYLQVKSAILQRIDPRLGEFLPDDVKHDIRLDEILWGGVKVDGIPALTNPKFLTASEAVSLEDDEAVFGVEINGDARAYPLRIMDWHEMANDVVGGVPVALAYCTLCGSAILYGTKSGDTVFTFGSSGLLYRSNKLMYDHQTKSLWAELYGRPVVGRLVGSGIQLKYLPIVRTSWKLWKAEHPSTTVLSNETGYRRDYSPGAAYGKYFESDETMFPVPAYDRSLKPKDWVYGVIVGGHPKAYPLSRFENRNVVNDSVAGKGVVVVAEGEVLSVRVYERAGVAFAKREGNALFDSSGRKWKMKEAYLEREEGSSPTEPNGTGERLPRLPGHLAYWFGWYAFFPQTEVYSSD